MKQIGVEAAFSSELEWSAGGNGRRQFCPFLAFISLKFFCEDSARKERNVLASLFR
jgi:hypothetical protein